MHCKTFIAVFLVGSANAQVLGGLLNTVAAITDAANGVKSGSTLLSFWSRIPTGQMPSSMDTLLNAINTTTKQAGKSPLARSGLMKRAGIWSLTDPVGEQLSGCGQPCSDNNAGNPNPPTPVYVQAQGDAPWSVSERKLRSAIYIPPTFTHGKVTPIIFVPGTGNYGKQTFNVNMGKKFAGSSIADPVYSNVPEYLLDDAQINGEYTAYAIKYISAIAKRNVAVMTWSQGSLDTAWALQYWPSARKHANDVINIAGDYKGTPFLDVLCLLPVCEYADWQQKPSSQFIATLRDGGGGSAYVPTTSIMSVTDDIVPQVGGPAASGYIDDTRGVGVSNTFIQTVCAGSPAGVFPYTHEGTIYSNLAYDLAVDAITHDGPGRVDRLDVARSCGAVATRGLSVLDVAHTQMATTVSFYNIFTFPPTEGEPPIKAYARK